MTQRLDRIEAIRAETNTAIEARGAIAHFEEIFTKLREIRTEIRELITESQCILKYLFGRQENGE